MELAKRVLALLLVAGVTGVGTAAVTYRFLENRFHLLNKEYYDCGVGVKLDTGNYCIIYSLKGFLDAPPNSGSGNNDEQQREPVRPTKPGVPRSVENF